METKRYVLCDSCNSKIYLGSEVYCFDGYCGVYCSAECFTEAHATIKALSEYEAQNCCCDILDEKAIETKKADIQREMLRLQNELAKYNELG